MTAAVVTGIGVLAPTGVGVEDYWSAALDGRTGIGPVTRFDASGYPARLAGEVTGFEAGEHLSKRLLPQTDRMTRMALVASDWALADAGVDPRERTDFDMGVVTASSSGGFEFGQRELAKLWSHGPDHVSAYQSFAWFYAVNTGQISIRHGMRGRNGVLVTEQAGGLDAVGQARRQIRDGVGLVVSGGVDGSLCPWGWVAQLSNTRLSHHDDPRRAYLPFDADASGYVPGEGGAILVIENGEQARSRGVGYGEIAGYASTFDAGPGADGEPGLRRALTLALADAGIDSSEVDVVFADGAGVPELDLAEARAINDVFGRGGVPVTVPKTATGRLYSGGAALDLAAALLTIRHGVIPPTVNVSGPAPGYDLDLVTGAARRLSVRTAVVLARGYGGFNAAMVLRAW
ncbi:ketosynthase chain-length factor [Kutzneria sp. NPDC051319]|uniref:ketosynthase chain-length factor n=1 Tax=Kutzneria sp. NPDC051319 TaxID=3155047 RepID=UPI003440FA2B